MPSISYITRFYPIDGGELTEEYFYNTEEEAIEHANMLTEDIGELYEGIEVARLNWYTHEETSLHYYDS